jgi:hypothetical protein
MTGPSSRLSQLTLASLAFGRAAHRAQVDLIGDQPDRAMLDALDGFVRNHPGTEAAAKALHKMRFHLAHNAFSFGEREGADPTERFFRVCLTAIDASDEEPGRRRRL